MCTCLFWRFSGMCSQQMHLDAHKYVVKYPCTCVVFSVGIAASFVVVAFLFYYWQWSALQLHLFHAQLHYVTLLCSRRYLNPCLRPIAILSCQLSVDVVDFVFVSFVSFYLDCFLFLFLYLCSHRYLPAIFMHCLQTICIRYPTFKCWFCSCYCWSCFCNAVLYSSC